MHLTLHRPASDNGAGLPSEVSSSKRIGDRCSRLALAFLCLALACGCRSQPEAAAQLDYEVVLTPSPPKVGPTQLAISVKKPNGEPVEAAQVRVEGNMNHAGMKPSFAQLSEERPGQYVGTLDFTMGGDWFLLITTTTRDGTKREHKVDIPGVQSK